MSKPILEIENVSKQYRLGYVGTGTLSDDAKRWWYRMRGKEDPFMKVGEENKRGEAGDSEYVWALRDINLQVQEGEVLGIIGANGAGKSTLLKLLSRVTGPTTGKITARGRIASLLEVGTGFHPELTGRENIYLNGSILGMTKKEINSKLDEIIDFSGCERYIDTPVKRYSSGMNVRLGFAVAAHLEPEILIVDEVLAVGDAEFQKKAIGKMKDVSKGQGRTVLFVSHNMDSIEQLCTSSIYMENGQIKGKGLSKDIINQYLSCNDVTQLSLQNPKKRIGSRDLEFISIEFENQARKKTKEFNVGETIIIKARIKVNQNQQFTDLVFGIGIDNVVGKRLFTGTSSWIGRKYSLRDKAEYLDILFEIKNVPFIKGNYIISLIINNGILPIDYLEQCDSFAIIDNDLSYGLGRDKSQGDIKLDYNIEYTIL
jgi:lipopolysaccharide transport system ATP-binding protein